MLLESILTLERLIFNPSGNSIMDFMTTNYNVYGRPGTEAGTYLFHSRGLRKIRDEYYEFNFKRTIKKDFKSQSEFDNYIEEIITPLDIKIFESHEVLN
ncbi:MAG: hypothetical protein IPQ02_03995 [Saprospiraceae bacterium]|uniref:Uncharacterized protein n=1 Tax=Candidatus Defluviibacterium haderslevense TaxID=2981993 RepID=A0A9D7XE96_9BACT|nr:hypothetical protein [Candidatus Defluviibacterium haderslevense]MBL0235783.1 hypothetical protein [Candidatus Defluviibacterium haderslevense]